MSKCEHEWETHLTAFEHIKADLKGVGYAWPVYWCLNCGAIKCYDSRLTLKAWATPGRSTGD